MESVVGLFIFLIYLTIPVLLIVAYWKIFAKAGQPGWAALIPFFNLFIYLKIVERPLWWFILMFLPFVNFIIGIVLSIDLAKKFGKGTGFGIGLLFLSFIFAPILAFGDAEYQGSTGSAAPA